MRVKRQVSGFLAIALKEPRQGFAGVHDAKISGIMNQFLVFIWRRRCRCDKLVFHVPAERQELLVGLRSEAAQNACLIQRDSRELLRVQLPIPDALIIRDAVPAGGFRFRISPDIL